MNRLAKIVQSATPSRRIQFRRNKYGKSGAREFLRDLVAMANADVDGSRYIIVGAGFDSSGHKQLDGVGRDDFAGKPSYLALAGEFIEPAVRLRYESVIIDDTRVGVYEIGDCQDRPYMMRKDFSETLRRGDAYIRAGDRAVKMNRRQLQTLFEKKFRESVSGDSIEIGFPGEIIHKDMRVPVCDLSQLPSETAATNIRQFMEVKSRMNAAGGNTMVARLTHARLFGTDSPYEDRSPEELAEEMHQIRRQYRDQDEHYLFDQHGQSLQFVIYNQGDEPVRDASLTLVMPNHEAFYVANRLPKRMEDGGFVERIPSEQADYPSVTLSDDKVRVSANLGDVPAGEIVEVFTRPLIICAGKDLAGRRIGIQFALDASNLRAPARSKLRLLL
jgi:hypothetical protein